MLVEVGEQECKLLNLQIMVLILIYFIMSLIKLFIIKILSLNLLL